MRSIFAIATFFVLPFAALSRAATPTLRAGDATLEWVGNDAKGYAPRISVGETRALAPAAASIFILPAGNETTQRLDGQAAVDATNKAVTVVKTSGGGVIRIEDEWTAGEDGRSIRMRRMARVVEAGSDRAFGSGFEMEMPAALALAEADVFIPGMWYGTAANTPVSSLIHDVGQSDFLLREDRMALPLVSLRDRKSGWTLTLTHEHPDGATIAADDNINRVIDARLQFGSLGLNRESDQSLRVAFRFPGTEGEQTSIFGFKPERRTAERLHPMVVGATQSYELTIRLSRPKNFPQQMRDAWRDAFARAKPATMPSDMPAAYKASIDVLDHYAYDRGKVSGVPFSASIPDGVVKDPSLQMGFVGQQLPCASYLIDEGIRGKRPELVAKGERIVDFWASESLSPAGVPRTWYDLEPQPHWRNYHTFLRVATDGTSGMLRAWQIERAAGLTKPKWLAFCRAVGDWLLKIQNPDGSFFREWTFDNQPASRSLTSTLHPVRLLVDLHCATGDARYRAGAIRAATYALAHNTDGRTYVGGTPDNPDVIDKEAGWIAMDSYLALYDVTHEQRWLDAAAAAATFTETWIYAWNVPLPADSNRITMPRLKTTAGAASLIATGHSGADLFLAYASLSYLRLSIYTDDAHFADVARLLQNNTAQLVDVNGSLGYAQPGLCIEAFSLAVNRGHSVGTWLPWCTSAIVEPMGRTREIFGVLAIDEVLKLNPTVREKRNGEFAKRRGFAKS